MEPRPKLIAMAAFDDTDEGDMIAAFDARQYDSEERATREARSIQDKHADIIAWSRDTDPLLGDFGPPNLLSQSGKIPDME